MSVNWKKGMFRLWIACSLFWVVAICVANRPDEALRTIFIFSNWPTPALETVNAVPCRDGRVVCDPWERDWGQENWSLETGDIVTTDRSIITEEALRRQELIAEGQRRNEQASNRLGGFLIVAALPPLMAILIWHGIIWIRRGFRAPSQPH